MALLSIHQNCQLRLQVPGGVRGGIGKFSIKKFPTTHFYLVGGRRLVQFFMKILLSQICTSVEDTSGLQWKFSGCNLVNKCPCQIWVGCGCWYFAEVLVWYLTTHRDLSKIVLLVETCQISRDQTNISQKHQEFQNENFPLNIPCYMRRRRRWRGCWDWQISGELSFERKRISLPGRQLISRAIIWQLKTIWAGEDSWPGGRDSHMWTYYATISSQSSEPLQPLQPAVLDFPIKVTALSDGWQSHSQSVAAREGWRAEILHWARGN